jgi:hypothetical protein
MVEVRRLMAHASSHGAQLRSCSWLVLVQQIAEQVASVHPTPLSFMKVVSVLAVLTQTRPQPGLFALPEAP